MSDVAALEREMSEARAHLDRLERAVGEVLVGQREVVEHVVMALVAGGHVLLEGAPGLGKTSLVRAMADAVDLSFARIQFTPDLMPADITGTNVVVDDPNGRKFRFQKGPVFANLVLADEINRTTPKTQSALLEAMQEGAVTVAGETHRLPDPFMVFATQNPIEMEGTYPLPEAQLDRFLLKVLVPFPGPEDLKLILARTTGAVHPAATKTLDAADLKACRDVVRGFPASPGTTDAAVHLVMSTHPARPEAPDLVKRFVRYGASPRGAQALVVCAKVRALRAGRVNASVADVLEVAPAALRHRVILNYEGEAEGLTTDRIVKEVVGTASKLR